MVRPQFTVLVLHPLSLIFIVTNLCIHIYIFFVNTSLLHILLLSFSLFSWQKSPLMRRYLDLKLRKRRVWTLCTVGFKWGVSLLNWRRRQSILFSLFLVSMWLSSSFYIPTSVLFHLLGAGSTEKGRHPVGGSPEIRDRGTALMAWRRWKWQWQVQRWRVSMGF